jgi:hypothetical protein
MFTFAHNCQKTLAEPNATCRLANVLKMSNIEHFPAVERCIVW